MISVGLTGGIASGKSEVGRLMRGLGAVVVDADLLAHEVYSPGTDAWRAIVAAFGDAIVSPNGSIDRAALGKLVFGDAERLQRLTDIVWPATRSLVEAAQRRARDDGAAVFVVEAALLLEAGWRQLFDVVWLVEVSRQTAASRLAQRGLDAAAIEARLASQQPAGDQARDVDLTIENNGDLSSLRAQVEAAWAGLRGGSRE